MLFTMSDTIIPHPILTSNYATTLLGLCVALGIGLLIGAERERRKSATPHRSAAGIRTFAVVSILGAVGEILGGDLLLAIVTLIVGIGILISYYRTRDEDPGLTTEFALLLTCLLGGFSMYNPLLAGSVGAVLALLLASRNRIHHFVRRILSEQELHDIILFSATALIILPLAPNRYLGPFNAINPLMLAELIVIVMAISASGYIAMRWIGAQHGLPLAGFVSGFVSSTATIHAMGERAARNPHLMGAAVSGAVLSSFATIIQMSIVIALIKFDLLLVMITPLVLGGITAGAYGLIFFKKERSAAHSNHTESGIGRAFYLRNAVAFSILLGTVLVVSAGLNQWLGDAGMMLGAAVSGLADAHATAASVASLLAGGKITDNQAVIPILIGLTTNTITKGFVAISAGGRSYAAKIIPGLIATLIAVWSGAWLAT